MTQGTVGTVSQARTGPMPTGGRWGWYRDHEGNEYRRVSTLIKEVETDTYNLDLWKQRQVAEGLAQRDDLVFSLKAMGRPPVDGWTQADKKKINGIVKTAMEAAKTRDGGRVGTAVHDLTERIDRGEPVDEVVRGLPAVHAETLRAYAFLRRENGWQTVEIERTVHLPELECAGTFDRIDLVPGLAALLGPGTCQYGHAAKGMRHDVDVPGADENPELPVIVDVKTEESPWLNGLHIGPQLAIYSRAKRMWRPTGGMVEVQFTQSGPPETIPAGEYVPVPCVRQDVAVVVHLRDGKAGAYFINLTEGWDAAQAAYAQMKRKARAKTAIGSPGAWFAPVPNVVKPRIAQMLVENAAAKDVMNGHALPGALTPNSVLAHEQVGAAADSVVEQLPPMVAVQRGDGMVEWQPTALHEQYPGELQGAPGNLPSGCNNCAPLVAGASLTRVDGTELGQCKDCGSEPWAPGGVEWQPNDEFSPQHPDNAAVEPPIGTQVKVGGISFTKVDTVENVVQHGVLDEVDRSAIEAVWAKTDLEGLAEVYRIYTDVVGRPWGGRVAEAGVARRRQIECPQRALHTGGKCACGWTAGVPA